MPHAYVAIDLGAESGRVIVGVLEGGRLRLEEVHRFAHEPVWLPTGLHWDTTGIWREIIAGLGRAARWTQQHGVAPRSIGVDTWGVDWALLGESGELIALPHAYRDPRNEAAFDEAVARLTPERIYRATGIQLMSLNTLYSLYAQQLAAPETLAAARHLVFMPDLFHYWLSGRIAVEATNASTSQMVDCQTGQWAIEMVAELGLEKETLHRILPEPVPPGTRLGTLTAKVAALTGLPVDLAVVAPATHDTASAVAAVPATGDESWCYLSSGTWSLLGAELDAPCTTAAAQAAMFTNELGIGGKIRFLKNITGLWMVQECRRDLERQGTAYDYAELTRLAAAAEPFRTLVNPAYPPFVAPDDMLRKLAEYAATTGQPTPEMPGHYVRCALESLALAYREKLALLEQVLGRTFDVLHIVGGGGQNRLLCQMTADAIGRRVVVGPYEATATGNLLVQAMAMGEVTDIAHLRQIVADSFELHAYQPQDTAAWDAAYARYEGLPV